MLPGLRTACHSLSDFCTGCSMMRDDALLLKSDPRKGIVGMDRRTTGARTGDDDSARMRVGRMKATVVLVTV